jgi:hypothetical protein
MTMTRIAVLSLALSSLGCASTGSASRTTVTADRTQMKDGRVMVCQMERSTGSNIPERVCHVEQDAATIQSQEVRDLFDRPAVQNKPGG